MLNRIRALAASFGAAQAARVHVEAADATDAKHLAAAVLMVEAALMDGTFDDDEAAAIQRIVQERFGLNEEEAKSLLEEARGIQDDSHHLLRFTRTIKDTYPIEERVEIIEMLWEVAYADGELHHFEANLVRRVGGLIYVPDQESGAARKRVASRLGIDL